MHNNEILYPDFITKLQTLEMPFLLNFQVGGSSLLKKFWMRFWVRHVDCSNHMPMQMSVVKNVGLKILASI